MRRSPPKCVVKRPAKHPAMTRCKATRSHGSRTIVSHFAIMGAAVTWTQTAQAANVGVLQYPDDLVLVFQTVADLWPIAIAMFVALVAHTERQRAQPRISTTTASRASWGKQLLMGIVALNAPSALAMQGRPARTAGRLSLTSAPPAAAIAEGAAPGGTTAATPEPLVARAPGAPEATPLPPPDHPPPIDGPFGQESDGYTRLLASTASLPPSLLRTSYLVDTGTQISLVCSKDNLTDMVPLAKPLAWASAAEGQVQQASHRGTLTIPLMATDGSTHLAKIPGVYYAESARLNAMSPSDLADAGVTLKLSSSEPENCVVTFVNE